MKIGTVAGALCFAAGALFLPGAGAVAMDDLSARLRPALEEAALPGLVAAVVKDGEIVAAGAVGLRALGHDDAATVADRIHVGSNGKAMTALLAGMMVEEGRLRWDSTLGEVLGTRVPGIDPVLAAVTLDQLLSHASGIPQDTPEMLEIYFNDNAFDHTPRDLRVMALEAWKHHAPALPEGSPFQYSNFGYMMAGAMIEEASGMAWEQLIRERLFQPFGLDSAGLGATATPGRVDAMAGHLLQADGTAAARLWGNGADMPTLLGPAGTVHMSILDFARWAGWVAGKGRRGPNLVTPETLGHLLAEKVRTPRRPNPLPGTPAEGGYASGWSLEKFDWADRELLTHNGSNGMNLAKILVDPEHDLAVVVATNIGGRAADQAAGQLMGALYTAYR